MPKTWEVYNRKTGEFITAGTTAECAAVVGLSKVGFRDAALSPVHRLKIVDTTETTSTLRRGKTDQDVIAAWDAFMEPLRKEFGIPVRKPKKENKNQK